MTQSRIKTDYANYANENRLCYISSMRKAFLGFLTLLAVTAISQPVLQQPAAVQMIAVEGEGSRYWPRWRGPSGQGLASGTGYPDTWSATENVGWKTRVPGR